MPEQKVSCRKVRLQGRTTRAERMVRDHGEWWVVKGTDDKWFTKEIINGKTVSHIPGMRLEAAQCSCQTCVLYGPISHWMYISNDTEYKIIEEES